jgi:hypothetical protein
VKHDLHNKAAATEADDDPSDGLAPPGDWPGWDEISAAGLVSGMGPGPKGYWAWKDVALALHEQKKQGGK